MHSLLSKVTLNVLFTLTVFLCTRMLTTACGNCSISQCTILSCFYPQPTVASIAAEWCAFLCTNAIYICAQIDNFSSKNVQLQFILVVMQWENKHHQCTMFVYMSALQNFIAMAALCPADSTVWISVCPYCKKCTGNWFVWFLLQTSHDIIHCRKCIISLKHPLTDTYNTCCQANDKQKASICSWQTCLCQHSYLRLTLLKHTHQRLHNCVWCCYWVTVTQPAYLLTWVTGDPLGSRYIRYCQKRYRLCCYVDYLLALKMSTKTYGNCSISQCTIISPAELNMYPQTMGDGNCYWLIHALLHRNAW